MTSDSGISERVVAAEVRRILQTAAKAGSIECVSTRQRGLYCSTRIEITLRTLTRRIVAKSVAKVRVKGGARNMPLWRVSNDLLFCTQNLGIEEDELKGHKAIIKDTIEKFIVCVRRLPILS